MHTRQSACVLAREQKEGGERGSGEGTRVKERTGGSVHKTVDVSRQDRMRDTIKEREPSGRSIGERRKETGKRKEERTRDKRFREREGE